ncbi:AraC family transcriptional regulator [Cohnella thailandensis]|uniref:AraC family transcriptional regulator n=1 Tax=Cohnella thailandensis TaxID=557557 RepID=A0A841SVD1_9BACL|nr:AraC family transcriptional regulator [Cohnella thailandensis]MBB6634556.1 AraC family transcriptional regulator [Cohnella thailandensis]MBP1972889.1 AraC-like DNA-binding protein [Cohnella thailandensis]
MKPIQKQFNVTPSFPFSFVYRDTKTKQRELPDHLHDWYEMVYVHGGRGTFFIDRTFYEMNAGSLFLIPGNTIHRAIPDALDPVTSTAVFFHPILLPLQSLGEPFSYLQSFDRSRLNRTYRLKCSPSLQAALEQSLNEIDRELRASESGVRHAVSLLLQRILLAVHRELGAELRQSSPSPAIGPVWMRDALLHIDEHYSEEIGLHELSRRASVSPAHFSRVFKQLTGMNVTGFIAAKRIIKAKERLLETDLNVAVIAAECGFDNLPHFHRLFKRIVGKTPSAYRRGPER